MKLEHRLLRVDAGGDDNAGMMIVKEIQES